MIIVIEASAESIFWHVRHTRGLDSRQLLKTVKCPKTDRKKNTLIKTIPEANKIFKTLSESYCLSFKMKLLNIFCHNRRQRPGKRQEQFNVEQKVLQ